MESGNDNYLTKVRGLAADHIYACGENGTVLRYDGKQWNDLSL